MSRSGRIIRATHSLIVQASPDHIELLAGLGADEGVGAILLGSDTLLGQVTSAVRTIRRHNESLPIIWEAPDRNTPVRITTAAPALALAGVRGCVLRADDSFSHWARHLREVQVGPISTDMTPAALARAHLEGVQNFLIPNEGTEAVSAHQERIAGAVGDQTSPALYIPLIALNIDGLAEAAGSSWHAIVGPEVYQATDPRGVIVELGQQMLHLTQTP